MKDVANAISLALLLSANVVAVFAHGWLGTGSLFTGAYLVILTGFLALFGRWRSLLFADFLWLCLCGLLGISAILHSPAASEAALLALALAAYPASRGLSGVMQKRSFLLILIAMVGAGTVLTLLAFNTEASRLHGRPLIFGQYDHALTQFALLLALLLFAFACSAIRIERIAPLCVVPIATFAAAQVRFVFIAIVGSLVLAAMIGPSERRRFGVIVGLVMSSVLVGALCRPDATAVYTKYAGESLGSLATAQSLGSLATAQSPADGCALVNPNNSLDIRLQVYREALAALPEAGAAGIGLGRFAERSCVKSQVHNTILQTALELGIPAGLVLVSFIIVVWVPLSLAARQSRNALFALCVLSFAVLLSMVYGTLASSGFLFVALGYGVATLSRREASGFGISSDLSRQARCPESAHALQ